ncbi:MAG: 30S ribosomal protein S12 methylthiotransferase RimO [Planctomycetes bacterium]|nr:30S ribosomal protein S12 methylthiotransferase RimO [Planctomycetota bacterium]
MKNTHNSPKNQPVRVNFVSLGCPKNLIDSEKMLAHLVESEFALVPPDFPADVTIINTCGFIEAARQEATDAINDALQAKKDGLTAYIVVTGCLAQYHPEKLKKQHPQLDAIIGLSQRSKIAQIIQNIINKKKGSDTFLQVTPFKEPPRHDRIRLRLTDPGWAYLRISEGCNRGCTFCTIPQIRGPYRSKPLDEILAEATELISDGAVELNLIGQEISSYGSDLDQNLDLAQLLHYLNQLDGLRWIRLLYAHPATLTTQHIHAIAECDKVLPYLDIPLQHISDRILKLMRRHITRAQTEKLLQQLRHTIENLTLRTTMLVGFPSETDTEFDELLDFITHYRFEALGAFIFSPEENTPAFQMEDKIPQTVKQQRFDQIMLTQQQIAFDHAESLLNREIPCLINHPLEAVEVAELTLDPSQNWFLARHPGQAPEIDSECYLAAETTDLDSGDIINAQISQRFDYDLIGSIIL